MDEDKLFFMGPEKSLHQERRDSKGAVSSSKTYKKPGT